MILHELLPSIRWRLNAVQHLSQCFGVIMQLQRAGMHLLLVHLHSTVEIMDAKLPNLLRELKAIVQSRVRTFA